jgi:hypothetical protein
MSARMAVPLSEVLLLTAWIGAALLFTTVVAPAAFAVLPTRSLAGALVGRVLPALFYTGVIVGSVIVLLDMLMPTKAWGRVAAGALYAVACAVAQLAVGSRIDRLRAQIGGPLDALAADDPRRLAFGKLHAISVAWLAVAMIAALVALVLAIRSLRLRLDPTAVP